MHIMWGPGQHVFCVLLVHTCAMSAHCIVFTFIHTLMQEQLAQPVHALKQGLNQAPILKRPKRDPEHDNTYQHEH